MKPYEINIDGAIRLAGAVMNGAFESLQSAYIDGDKKNIAKAEKFILSKTGQALSLGNGKKIKPKGER